MEKAEKSTGSLWEVPVREKKSLYSKEQYLEVPVLRTSEYQPTWSTVCYCVSFISLLFFDHTVVKEGIQ